MKSAYILLVLITASTSAGLAQNSPAIPGQAVTIRSSASTSNSLTSFSSGYEGLAWGSTIQQVLQKYPSLWYSPDQDHDFPNSKKGVVKSSSGAIKEREFVFVDGKLVKVIVSYNVENLNVKGLVAECLKRFGKADDYTSEDKMLLGTKAEITTISWDTPETAILLRAVDMIGNSNVVMLYVSKEGQRAYAATKQSVEF